VQEAAAAIARGIGIGTGNSFSSNGQATNGDRP